MCVRLHVGERERERVGENWLSFVSVCHNGNFLFPLKQCCESEIIKQGCDGNVESIKVLLRAGHDRLLLEAIENQGKEGGQFKHSKTQTLL